VLASFCIKLPVTHRGRALQRLVHVWLPHGDASSLLQDAVDRAARAWQSFSLQLRIAWQVVQQRFGPRRAPQALRWLIAHLEEAVDHHLTDPLGRVRARS